MANPVILVVDDDPQVLRAVERELRGRFGSDYRVVAAGSGADALDAIRRLILRGTPIALLVADQRMPAMTGVELLRATLALLPGTKRVLLTAYADTDVAIRAINEIGLDQYLLKPWDPPEDRLFPALVELLDDWRAGWIPPFEGVRLVGHRWSARARPADACGPAVLRPRHRRRRPGRPRGRRLRRLRGAPDAARGGEAPGGQAGTTSRIENYLGFPAGLSGADLARRAVTQATRLGAEILTPRKSARSGARTRTPSWRWPTGPSSAARP